MEAGAMLYCLGAGGQEESLSVSLNDRLTMKVKAKTNPSSPKLLLAMTFYPIHREKNQDTHKR